MLVGGFVPDSTFHIPCEDTSEKLNCPRVIL